MRSVAATKPACVNLASCYPQHSTATPAPDLLYGCALVTTVSPECQVQASHVESLMKRKLWRFTSLTRAGTLAEARRRSWVTVAGRMRASLPPGTIVVTGASRGIGQAWVPDGSLAAGQVRVDVAMSGPQDFLPASVESRRLCSTTW